MITKKICFILDTQGFTNEKYNEMKEHCYSLEKQGIGEVYSKDTINESYSYEIELDMPLEKNIVLNKAEELAKKYGFEIIELWQKLSEKSELYDSGVSYNIEKKEIDKFHTEDEEWSFLDKDTDFCERLINIGRPYTHFPDFKTYPDYSELFAKMRTKDIGFMAIQRYEDIINNGELNNPGTLIKIDPNGFNFVNIFDFENINNRGDKKEIISKFKTLLSIHYKWVIAANGKEITFEEIKEKFIKLNCELSDEEILNIINECKGDK